ncbi:hypothetical protein TDB9533_00810 [Thalassocella blandensis]|nr:hypothetical protein TDB9533_00810 [Thalassocella blandensis]
MGKDKVNLTLDASILIGLFTGVSYMAGEVFYEAFIRNLGGIDTLDFSFEEKLGTGGLCISAMLILALSVNLPLSFFLKNKLIDRIAEGARLYKESYQISFLLVILLLIIMFPLTAKIFGRMAAEKAIAVGFTQDINVKIEGKSKKYNIVRCGTERCIAKTVVSNEIDYFDKNKIEKIEIVTIK